MNKCDVCGQPRWRIKTTCPDCKNWELYIIISRTFPFNMKYAVNLARMIQGLATQTLAESIVKGAK